MKPNTTLTLIGYVAVALAFPTTVNRAQEPLPSWNDGEDRWWVCGGREAEDDQ